MQQFESAHYLFHYGQGTPAERDIREIAAYQEACFRYICDVLGTTPDFKIQYFLCDTPEEVGRVYGDNEPCNGFAAPPDKIYAVYNEQVKCIGFHEDAHIVSYTINRPHAPAIREGLAMYFDRKWWGIQNLDWVGFFLKSGRYLPVDSLLNEAFFFEHDCSVTYPIMGAFTEWLITSRGSERYMQMYCQENMVSAMESVYGLSPSALDQAFRDYVRLFRTDKALEKRMEKLINGSLRKVVETNAVSSGSVH